MTRPLAMILVAMVVVTWAGAFLLDGKSLDASFLKPFSTAVGVLTGVGFAYEHWLWHWPGIHLLAKKPRLTGTWVGELRSDYKRDPNDEALPPT